MLKLKYPFVLIIASLVTFATTSTLPDITRRATGGYVQNPVGNASFTMYSGCSAAACGVSATGFTAAMNQLSYGAPPGVGPGDACGRCFAVTANLDPFSPSFAGPFSTVVVKVTDLCPVAGNQEWCGQTQASPENAHGEAVHFDLCEDTGAAAAFFPSGMMCAFVPCCWFC